MRTAANLHFVCKKVNDELFVVISGLLIKKKISKADTPLTYVYLVIHGLSSAFIATKAGKCCRLSLLSFFFFFFFFFFLSGTNDGFLLLYRVSSTIIIKFFPLFAGGKMLSMQNLIKDFFFIELL